VVSSIRSDRSGTLRYWGMGWHVQCDPVVARLPLLLLSLSSPQSSPHFTLHSLLLSIISISNTTQRYRCYPGSLRVAGPGFPSFDNGTTTNTGQRRSHPARRHLGHPPACSSSLHPTTPLPVYSHRSWHHPAYLAGLGPTWNVSAGCAPERDDLLQRRRTFVP
jgi:hypothetical protein